MLIREVILENFMSYEYARIPLKSGLNVICGPNGSGKSSILLAISVALGQAYTERSRRLSDLISWGKDSARVTLIFDNSPIKGRRPISKYDADYLRVSRYINRAGNYWFEVNFQTVTKGEVTSVLSEFGIDPDNMLIIMHQNMMEEFGSTSPSQKLRMVEEAIGIGKYRTSILEAQQKLEQVLSEERSIHNLFEKAEATLAYWKEEYEKFQKRKALLNKQAYLERELFWSQVIRQENIVESWKNRIERVKTHLTTTIAEIEEIQKSVCSLGSILKELRQGYFDSFYSLLTNEKEKARCEAIIEVLERLNNVRQFMYGFKSEALESRLADLKTELFNCRERVKEYDSRIHELRSRLIKLEDKTNSVAEELIEKRVREGVLEFQRKLAEEEIKALDRELRAAQKVLDDMKPLISGAGSRIETMRTPQEVSEELKMIAVQLAAIGEASEDVEKMYFHYLDLLSDLKTKALTVANNREQVLREVEERLKKWRETIEKILTEVSMNYNNLLSAIGARGLVRLIDSQDIEKAGLELVVGFRGAPQVLNAYTQSGGERSAATMLFLLALQQYLKSPFRAVDEFDVHMDPRNRELITEILIKAIKHNKEAQYLIITPGHITTVDDIVHVITVQNISGHSEVMVVD